MPEYIDKYEAQTEQNCKFCCSSFDKFFSNSSADMIAGEAQFLSTILQMYCSTESSRYVFYHTKINTTIIPVHFHMLRIHYINNADRVDQKEEFLI